MVAPMDSMKEIYVKDERIYPKCEPKGLNTK